MTRCNGRRRTAIIAVLVAVVTVLAGCTGVPTASRPEVVKTLPGAGVSPAALEKPTRDVMPHDLVQQFLTVNALPGANYASARNFLTPAERSRWQDTTATVVDETTVGLYPSGNAIVVHGRTLGTVNQNGVYAPTLPGANARPFVFKFRIARVHGQYRINGLNFVGLLLTETQFQASFTERSLYFFDLPQKYLVPDPRWTALTDPTQLDEWLLTQLFNGPTAQLASAVTALPTQASARRISVTVGTPIKIEIPGSSQLDDAVRGQLAAQIATTLDDADRRTFEITDGSSPLNIPSVGRTEFTAADFTALAGPPQPAGDVYFTRDGKLISGEDFTMINGAVNNGDYYLYSVAVSRSDPTGGLAIAAVVKSGAKNELVVGTQSGGLGPTSIRGLHLSRPAFAPGRDEVWVGVGSKIELATLSGRTAKITPVAVPTSPGEGQIVALRLSPEGSRIAIVIKAANNDQQLFIGSIVRGGGQVRIGQLQQINPQNTVITDVGWIEPAKLYATGHSTSSALDTHIYETDVDGSMWTAMGIGSMPLPPSSFTVTPGQPGWAESESSLWVQRGSSWQSAGPVSRAPGINPVYLG